MKRLIPHPLLSFSLLVMWLLLNQSLSPGTLLLGTLVGLAGGWIMTTLSPEPVRVRLGWPMVKLLGIVLSDIVRSNIAVGRIVLWGRSSTEHTSGFVLIPLDMRNSFGLATLSLIITATPGTLWVQYDGNRNVLLIHVLDLVDEDHWIALIKRRYEKLLMQVFA